MKRILCLLGFHPWTYYIKRRYYRDRFCPRCGCADITYNTKKDDGR